MLAGVIEIRLPRWPIKGGRGGEYAADVGPSIGMDVEAFLHVVTYDSQRSEPEQGAAGHGRTRPDTSALCDAQDR